MSKQCLGCGAILQFENSESLGYSPKQDAQYCQRCFRLTHYNDVTISMQKDIQNDTLLRRVNELDALVVWVVDMIDFSSSMLQSLHRHLQGKDILLVCTKSDLLPRDTNSNKIARFIQKQLQQQALHVCGIVVSGNWHKQDETSIEQVKDAIETFRHQRDVVLLGQANAGKSSVLNALLRTRALTTSYQPGTTLDLHPITFEQYTLYDTPGLVNYGSCLTYADQKTLQEIVLHKQLNPKKFQLTQSQSLAIGGLVRLDLEACEDVRVICYVSKRLKIHRGKQRQADMLWTTHFHQNMLCPVITTSFAQMKRWDVVKKGEAFDIVISGLGWICIHGKFKSACVYVAKEIDVQCREAMI
ncbi:MAG: GTPase [Breznakia sp.]